MDLGSHLVKPLILGLKVDQCPQGIPEMSLLGQLLKWFKGENILKAPLASTFQGETSQPLVFNEDRRQAFASQGCLKFPKLYHIGKQLLNILSTLK